jgi:hypothetical protein
MNGPFPTEIAAFLDILKDIHAQPGGTVIIHKLDCPWDERFNEGCPCEPRAVKLGGDGTVVPLGLPAQVTPDGYCWLWRRGT